MDDWRNAPIVDDPSDWKNAPVVGETPPSKEPPPSKSEEAFSTLNFLKEYGAAPFGMAETAINTAGNLGTKAVAGLAGMVSGSRRDSTRHPGAEVVENIEAAGRELFQPTGEPGESAEKLLSATTETAGTAIKYPLSAVPFALGGTDEREEFMELPMSQYLGELAQDNGASPLLATMAHMVPDVALIATGVAGKTKAGKPAPQKPYVPTIEQLKADSKALYKIVDDAGVRISDEAFQVGVQRIIADTLKGGARKELTPKTMAALESLAADAKAGGVTLAKAEELRRVLKKAQSGVEGSDIASATKAIAAYDRFIEGLTPAQLSGAAGPEAIEYLKSARSLWSRARKTEVIEEMFRKANIDAASLDSMSGISHSLRVQFRQLAKNQKKMKLFTKAEQAAITLVATGGSAERLARLIGRFAPANPWNLAGDIASGAGLGYVAGGGSPFAATVGAITVPIVGALGRLKSNKMTEGYARKASETMRQEAPLANQKIPSPEL